MYDASSPASKRCATILVRRCEKLAGNEEMYRVRQGTYRIVYGIHDEQVVVEVIRVGHRREVYRGR